MDAGLAKRASFYYSLPADSISVSMAKNISALFYWGISAYSFDLVTRSNQPGTKLYCG